MKARPRYAENKIAEVMSGIFNDYGLPSVERKPVIGRKGPDLTWNEAKIIIDVKSRKAVPLLYKFPTSEVCRYGELLAVKLSDFSLIIGECVQYPCERPISMVVQRWYENMDEWTQNEMPSGISALVLHWPRSKYANAVFVFKEIQWELLNERFSAATSTNQTAGRHEAGGLRDCEEQSRNLP